ncbi:hypothetical protein [Ruegeria atlantica]|uniref:hypothetical protein n=1 Tax=Ruegeria atlantica TaxID=81569 RepID=UPI0021BC28FD|nr:hypothetical protein [Ruegeria atlantica]
MDNQIRRSGCDFRQDGIQRPSDWIIAVLYSGAANSAPGIPDHGNPLQAWIERRQRVSLKHYLLNQFWRAVFANQMRKLVLWHRSLFHRNSLTIDLQQGAVR